MSEFKCPSRKSVRKLELPNEEGHLSEQFLAYKLYNYRSVYVSELTKAINKIKEYLNKNELSKTDRYTNCLDLTIDKIRRVSSKLNELVCNDDVSEEVLQFFTDQELRVIELRKPIFLRKSKESLKLFILEAHSSESSIESIKDKTLSVKFNNLNERLSTCFYSE